jgi:hypothetical protein
VTLGQSWRAAHPLSFSRQRRVSSLQCYCNPCTSTTARDLQDSPAECARPTSDDHPRPPEKTAPGRADRRTWVRDTRQDGAVRTPGHPDGTNRASSKQLSPKSVLLLIIAKPDASPYLLSFECYRMVVVRTSPGSSSCGGCEAARLFCARS